MQYLVFDTEAECIEKLGYINQRAREIFAAQGYEVTPEGAIVAKRASDGINVESAVTTTWDNPYARLTDGKWIIQHPMYHPSADFPLPGGITVLDYVTQDFDPSIYAQESAADWWPPPSNQ